MSYNKDKDDKAVYDNKVVIIALWDYFMIKSLRFSNPRFRVTNIENCQRKRVIFYTMIST